MTIAITVPAARSGRRKPLRTVATLDLVQRVTLLMGTCVAVHYLGTVLLGSASSHGFCTLVHLTDATLALSVMAYVGAGGLGRRRRFVLIVAAGVMAGLVVATVAGAVLVHVHTLCCCAGC